MSSRNSRNTKRKTARKAKPRRQPALRRDRKTNMQKNVQRMLLDPCNATLTPGIHTTSEGVLTRFKTITIPAAALQTAGYVVWFPDYASSAFGNSAFLFETDNEANVPQNGTTGDYYGTGFANLTADSLSVGAAGFVGSETCMDFRQVSSCIRLTYTGSLLDSKGIVSVVENLSADQLLYGDFGAVPATCQNILESATKTMRVGTTTHEVRSRPNPALSGHFKSDADSVITRGNATTATMVSNETKRFAPTGIGFCWSGVLGTDLRIEFIQNIEWRPRVSSGMAVAVPRQINDEGFISRVLLTLDKNFPGWTTSTVKTAINIGRMALGF